MLENLLEIPKKRIKILTLGSFTAFIILNIIMGSLRTASNGGYGIIAFEFSRTGEMADFIMNIWQAPAVNQEILITYLDFAYLVAYGLMASGLLLLAVQGIQGNENIQKILLISCHFPLISAIFDVIENVNLLIMLYNYPAPASDFNAFFAFFFALIKFFLLGMSLLAYIIALAYLLRKNGKNNEI